MLYHLLLPLSETNQFFNVFRYVTFRTAWGFVTALALCYLLYPWFINWMKQKRMEQIIRTDGPQAHIENKVGTPTMGGAVIILLAWGQLARRA